KGGDERIASRKRSHVVGHRRVHPLRRAARHGPALAERRIERGDPLAASITAGRGALRDRDLAPRLPRLVEAEVIGIALFDFAAGTGELCGQLPDGLLRLLSDCDAAEVRAPGETI